MLFLEGQYRFGWKNSDKVHFYRFTDPVPGYPYMIELFSREPEYMDPVPAGIVPLHIDDDAHGQKPCWMLLFRTVCSCRAAVKRKKCRSSSFYP